MDEYGYVDGYIERRMGGKYEGNVRIEGVDLSPVEAVYFKEEGENYLWIKRKPLLEYDFETQTYRRRVRQPQWECYLKKTKDGDTVAYKGEFVFMHFKFSITGVWDSVLGQDSKQRLNLFIERLPMNEQTIINNINKRIKKDNARTRH